MKSIMQRTLLALSLSPLLLPLVALKILMALKTLIILPLIIFPQAWGQQTQQVQQAQQAQATQSKIVGGAAVEGALYPWQVLVNVQNAKGVGSCGGSLIAPRWVLTAAHCVIYDGKISSPQAVTVALGSNDVSALVRQPRRVVGVIAHEKYLRNQNAPDDIALLQLELPLNEHPTLRLAYQSSWENTVGHQLKTLGWGRTREQGRGSQTLQITDLPIVNSNYCRQTYGSRFFNEQKQLCVGYLQGGKDSCNGDSGGALFRSLGRQATQYGIVSFGKGCARVNTPAVYVKVSAYIDWIKAQMGADAEQLQLNSEHQVHQPVPKQIAAGNRALLIGVKNYYLGGAFNLDGPEKDVANVKRLLIDYFNFRPQQIMTLTNEAATADNIRQAVKQWLIAQSRPGDNVWLYFSGHGAYLPDVSGDEKEIDAQIGVPADETILPYDVDILTSQKVAGGFAPYTVTTNHLLDDEIHTWTQQLNDRQLTVVFDSCHSGTATRALTSKTKSGVRAMRHWLADNVEGVAATRTADYRLAKGTTVAKRKNRQNQQKNMVFWSAASSSEQALDAYDGGMFTAAFVQGIKGKADANQDGDISYTELLSYVRKQIKAHTPQLEIDGSRLGESLFSGKPIEQPAAIVAQTLPVAAGDAVADSPNSPDNGDNAPVLQIDWLDSRQQPTADLRVCRTNNCPHYRLRLRSQKSGWLLLYDLEANGKLQQYVPHRQNRLLSEGVYLQAGKPFIFPIALQMSNPAPGRLIAIVLDEAEKANYDKIKYQLAKQRHADSRFFYEVLEQRDQVIGANGKPLPLSVGFHDYQPR